MMFNDREYIHRECTMIADSDSPQVPPFNNIADVPNAEEDSSQE